MCPRAKHQERWFLSAYLFERFIRFQENQSSDVAVAAQAQVGVMPFQVIYVAEICRFSTGYVTPVAAEAWGIGHFRNRGNGEECEARSESSRHLGKGRWSFTCPKMSQAATSCPLHVHFSRCILTYMSVIDGHGLSGYRPLHRHDTALVCFISCALPLQALFFINWRICCPQATWSNRSHFLEKKKKKKKHIT